MQQLEIGRQYQILNKICILSEIYDECLNPKPWKPPAGESSQKGGHDLITSHTTRQLEERHSELHKYPDCRILQLIWLIELLPIPHVHKFPQENKTEVSR
jgi:hypothetical protein